MAAKHQEIYTLNANIQALCDLIRSPGFANELRISLKSENPMPTGVWYRFHHGVSFSSWGEKITITLNPLAENATQVTIHSECGMPTQVIDWGKNKQIVRNVHQCLQARVYRGPVPQNNMNTPPMPSPPVQAAGSFCHMCGAPIDARSNFCPTCGAKLN